MNRKQRQALYREQHQFVSTLPSRLTPIPPERYPAMDKLPIKAWWSKKYMVQLWDEATPEYLHLKRLSISRALLAENGKWQDQLTWDELQAIKREIGFCNWYAVEVYPRDVDEVNVANIGHLWLFEMPLGIGWFA